DGESDLVKIVIRDAKSRRVMARDANCAAAIPYENAGRRLGSPFRVVIVSEQKSIGREMTETAYLLKRFGKAGVDVVEYVHGQSLVPRTPTAKLLSSVQGFSDEDHGVRSGERTKEAHTDRVQHGYCV